MSRNVAVAAACMLGYEDYGTKVIRKKYNCGEFYKVPLEIMTWVLQKIIETISDC